MNKLTYLVPVAAMMLAAGGCNKCTRLFDSEISAIDRQTQVIEEQNRLLDRIARALEKGEQK